MSTAEAAATAQARAPGSTIKFSSPLQIPVVGVVTEDEEAQVWPGVCALEGVKAGAEMMPGGSKGGNGGLRGNQGSPEDCGSKLKADPFENCAACEGTWLSSTNLSGDSCLEVLPERPSKLSRQGLAAFLRKV